MACDPASITAPLVRDSRPALAVSTGRPLARAHPNQAVSRHPVVRAARPSESMASALRVMRRPRGRCAIRYANGCAVPCIWRQTPSPRGFQPIGGRLLKGRPIPREALNNRRLRSPGGL